MKPNETVYLGDGAYLHYDGRGFEFRANDHARPTDRVYIEDFIVPELIRIMRQTTEEGGQ